jgi:serine/threonine-protein kinase
METLPPGELLPVLVADLADDEARDVLEAAAFAGGRVWVPLESAPVSAARHVLEVHMPGNGEPLNYIAEPLGPPTDAGFPLRLQPMPNAAPPRSARARPPETRDFVRGRRSQSSMTLSESHTKDLSHVGPMPTGEAGHDSKIGRALAGGKLVIEHLIGQGGVGAVYRARHRELMMPVAVKVLHESFQNDIDFARRFYAEALAASGLDHKNITRVIDFGQEPDGQLYFAMEFLAGEELRKVLDREHSMTHTRIASLMMQVCAGLSHAHARSVVHRDVKPENLMLVPGQDDDGRPIEIVKVCDFGIALHRALPADVEGMVAGTPEYMSPEQCRSDELDARSDVYACGIVLYELATGQVPFTADKSAQVLNKQQFTPPLPPSKVNPRIDPLLERIILKALQKEPARRQQTMRALRAELRELLDPIMVDASRGPVSTREMPAVDFQPVARNALPTLPEDVEEAPPPPSRREREREPAKEEPPAWLERGAVYQSTALTATGSHTVAGLNEPAAGAAPAPSDVAQTALAWSAHLTKTIDPAKFAAGVAKLEGALRKLAAQGDVVTLWTVSTTMHEIAAEGGGAVGSRPWLAAKLLRVFDDPAILAQVGVELFEGGTADARDKARRILVHAGVAGAYGLYGARVKLARKESVRAPFVAVLKDFGPKAWPVVRSALEKIAGLPNPNTGTLALAEDLLVCVPLVGDESAGHVALKFIRWNHSNVCRAATAAIVKLWGERSKPVLVGMVQSKEDVVRIAGIAGLRQLGAIDEHLVPRLHSILTRRVPAGEEVRAAAALALAHVSDTAKQPAVSLLAQLVTPPREVGPIETRPNGVMTKQDAVVLAMARSLLTIGGPPYRRVVAERADKSAEPLRGQLRGLLTG